MSEVIAIAMSDIHLSDNPPAARSAEPNWFEAMQRPLEEVRQLQYDLNKCPVIIAGDIFHTWKVSPALINFALDYLPDWIYAIPGQHDLPNHQYERKHESGYGVLQKTSKLTNLDPGVSQPLMDPRNDSGWDYEIVGFPWGFPAVPNTETYSKIAVVHSYIWRKGESYPNAPKESRADQVSPSFDGYEFVIHGDNHRGFLWGEGTCINCGAFIRRNIDEIDYEPQVGLLMDDHSIKIHKLESAKEDKFNSTAGILQGFKDGTLDARELVKEIRGMKSMTPDFVKSVFRALENCDQHVKNIVLEAMTPSIEEG